MLRNWLVFVEVEGEERRAGKFVVEFGKAERPWVDGYGPGGEMKVCMWRSLGGRSDYDGRAAAAEIGTGGITRKSFTEQWA